MPKTRSFDNSGPHGAAITAVVFKPRLRWACAEGELVERPLWVCLHTGGALAGSQSSTSKILARRA
jgi:hypothetical protein